MVTFTKLPQATLDVKSGKMTGIAPKPQPPTIGKMPIDEFTRQASDLAQKKVPLDKAISAVEAHPDIQDKNKAKSMLQAVYSIMEGGKKSK